MLEFVAQHQFWAAVAIYWIFSAAVDSMPDPAGNGSPVYLWLYRFSHTIAGNIATAFLRAARYRACASRGSRIPGLKGIRLVLLLPPLFSASACTPHYAIHPGALNEADSAAYDTLLIAETTIDQARLDYDGGQLPAEAKDALDALIRSYNIARASWLTYRGAVSANPPTEAYLNQLKQNLTDLANAIRALREPTNASPTRSASATARSLCAEHVQQLGSESLLSNLMEVKD